MYAKAFGCGLRGLDGFIVEVEADISSGLPGLDVVGLPDSSVKESRERVRTAMKNSGMRFPQKRVTINLAPASMKKEGAAFDLPISMAVLAADDMEIRCKLEEYMLIGELALDGKLRRINGVLPMVMCAAKRGIRKVIVPIDNAHEAAVVSGVEVYPAENLFDVYKHFAGEKLLARFAIDINDIMQTSREYDVDFAEVKGQDDVRRAVEIAVAGGHNILMVGSPGSGKSMIAKRIPTILPDLTYGEALDITRVHSVAGNLKSGQSLKTTRPFRSPHHTISTIGLVGGGGNPKPGELSLAHNGVLFMDELPEFNRSALEVMRQPLEDGTVTISRAQGSATYPCNMLLVASMNPCKCGYYGDRERVCSCTPTSVAKYRGKISGPLLDRIDIHIEVPSVKYQDLQGGRRGESSAEIKKRIDKARKRQHDRYKNDGIHSNSQLAPKHMEKFCKVDNNGRELLKKVFDRLGLSARAHDRILKVARTIADLDEKDSIELAHLSEAVQYRSFDRKSELVY